MPPATLLVACLLGAAAGERRREAGRARGDESQQAAFARWKAAHGVRFASAAEEALEYAQWADNDATIAAHNEAVSEYQLGHNAYSSHSWEQFKRKMNVGLSARKLARHSSALGVHRAGDYAGDSPALQRLAVERGRLGSMRMSTDHGNRNRNVPEARDWAAEGGVSPVYDQGSCGSVRAAPRHAVRAATRGSGARADASRPAALPAARPPTRSAGRSPRPVRWRASTLRPTASWCRCLRSSCSTATTDRRWAATAAARAGCPTAPSAGWRATVACAPTATSR